MSVYLTAPTSGPACTDTGLSNGTAYYYKIFEYDAYTNYYVASDVWTSGLTPISPDAVVAGTHRETVQDESQASYEGWCRTAEARIDWARPVDHVYNLIRGCNPAPGAWTTLGGKTLQIFDARKLPFRRFADVPGKIGSVRLVGGGKLKFTRDPGGLHVSLPEKFNGKTAFALKIRS